MQLSDVAAELNVSDSQVYHMVRSGELPAIKVGGRGQWRGEKDEVERFIQQKEPEARASAGGDEPVPDDTTADAAAAGADPAR